MFPIRDHNPSGRTPYVTYALVVINAAVFLAYWFGLPTDRQVNWFFYTWGVVPAALFTELPAGYPPNPGWPTLLTSMFLHGGWMHLIGNMLFLWVFGDNIEDELGHLRFLGFYGLAGIAASALQIVTDPLSPIPMVGASGAIAGVLGGYLLLFPRARIDVLFIFIIIFKVFPIPAWIVLGVWFGLQLLGGFNTPSDQGGVAYWAHAGGFVAGIALMLPLWRGRGGKDYWARTHGHPPHPATQYTRSRIPAVVRRR
jgi:membrane associated rhomboid family serine protease